MYKTYVCSSLFWEIPRHLIVNVYYMPPPPPIQCWEGSITPPPPFNVGRGRTRRPESKPTLNGGGGGRGGGIKLVQIVMYVHWIQINGSFTIRETEFVLNCWGQHFNFAIFSLIQVNGFRIPKNTIFAFSTNFLKQTSCIIFLKCTYWCKYFMFFSLHLHHQIYAQYFPPFVN